MVGNPQLGINGIRIRRKKMHSRLSKYMVKKHKYSISKDCSIVIAKQKIKRHSHSLSQSFYLK
jgi:hypothetical protein